MQISSIQYVPSTRMIRISSTFFYFIAVIWAIATSLTETKGMEIFGIPMIWLSIILLINVVEVPILFEIYSPIIMPGHIVVNLKEFWYLFLYFNITFLLKNLPFKLLFQLLSYFYNKQVHFLLFLNHFRYIYPLSWTNLLL